MNSWSRKAVTAFIAIGVLILLTTVGVLVVLRLTQPPGRGREIVVTVDDLARMKSLVYGYLNERNRMLISSEPEKDSNIAGAPVISTSDMSHELAGRQKEDVGKLKSGPHPGIFENFATYAQVTNIREDKNEVVLHVYGSTFYHTQSGNPPYSAEGIDYYFTFVESGGRWVLNDVKLPYAGTMPPAIEPSVKPEEVATERVLADPPKETSVILQEVRSLDRQATEQTKNKWDIDEQTAEAIESGTYSW